MNRCWIPGFLSLSAAARHNPTGPMRRGNESGVEETRVVLQLPRMVSDIVRDILEAKANVEIVATLDAEDRLDDVLLRHDPDMVILSEAEFSLPAAWLDLLEAHPGLRLLAISSGGHRSALCEVLGNVRPQELVTVVMSGRQGPEPPC